MPWVLFQIPDNLIVYENISIVYRAQHILHFTRPGAGESSKETKMSSTRVINKNRKNLIFLRIV